jgi:DNA repair exonuclease SbcCD nuclease subunit
MKRRRILDLLWFSDPHNSDTPPRSRKDSYTEDILVKQEAIAKQSKSYDLVICGGDVFHQKRADRISYKLVNRLCEIYREMGNLIIIPGNHDVESKWDFSVRPLGTLAYLPNVRLSHAEVIEFDDFVLLTYGGAEFFPEIEFVTWLRGESLKLTSARDKRHRVGTFHQGVGNLSWDLPFPIIDSRQIEDCVDFGLIGHIHSHMGYISAGKLYCSGAIGRGSLIADEIDRPVCYMDVDIRKDQITCGLQDLHVKLGEEVFKIAERQAEKKIEVGVQEFLSYIESFDLPKSMSVDEIISYLESNPEIDKQVAHKAIEILRGL